MENKKIITCDIDGILTDYPKCWLNFLHDQCGTYYSNTEDAKKSQPKYSYYKDMYRESEYKANLPINEYNKNILNQLAEKYDIIFATSRPLNNIKYPHLRENTFNWLKKNGLNFKELVFKDEQADFVKGLDVICHIEDDIKYANSVAKYMGTLSPEKRGKVFLYNDDNSSDSIESSIIKIKDLSEVSLIPFFSVCIPATNRGDTIYRALTSVAKQYYRNFEVILVDCCSSDNTVSEINRFLESDIYKENYFKCIFEKRDYTPVGTEDWNEPIKLASGKYIAMLEGDDKWMPEHLSVAYDAIINNPNIGIYGSSNLSFKRKFKGFMLNKKVRKVCFITNKGIVPPSESVFIRLDNNNQQFFYDFNSFKYSPEIGLYMDIALSGYNLYFSHSKDVYREPSSNPDKLRTWYYYADRFTFINKYKSQVSAMTLFNSRMYNSIMVTTTAFYTKSWKAFRELTKSLKNEVGGFITGLSSFISFMGLFFRAFYVIPKKIIKKIK